MNATTCLDMLARLYEYLDGEMPVEDADALRHHMEVCQGCYPFLRFCTSFQDALERAAQGQAPAPSGLRDRIAEILRAEGCDSVH